MRVLIVAAVLACAAAAPSGWLASPHALGHAPLLAHAAPYGVAHAAPYAVAHAAPLVATAPTIPAGDIQGAAIDAHVDASDHARASVDAAREYHDQASELHGQAINAAEDHSWQAVDAVKTHEAALDGAAAGAAPIIAKQLAGHVAPVAYGAHAYGGHGYGAHAYAAPAVYGAHAAYAAPVAASKTVVHQSLSQSHPAPLVHAPVVHAAPLAYGAHGAHLGYAAHAAPLAYGAHAAPLGYAGHGLAHGW